MGAPSPDGACDTHVHVFGPVSHYAYAPDRTYTPPDTPLADLTAMHETLGINRTVLIQPSPYGTDNTRLLDALRELGGTARGVAVIPPDADSSHLDVLHEAGVRGCRINLNVRTSTDIDSARERITASSQTIADHGWHLQLHAAHEVIAALGDLLPSLPTPVVLDHFAGIKSRSAKAARATDTVCQLLASGRIWVKLSAPYRVARDYVDLTQVLEALVAAGADRLVWGSDWPHTGGTPNNRDPRRTQPFLDINDAKSLTDLTLLLGTAVTHQVLVGNPAHLYDFD